MVVGKGKLFLFFEARENKMCLTVRLAFQLAGNGLGYVVVTEKSTRFFRTRQSVRKYVGFSDKENPP